jgi:hypothetical protein
MAEWSENSRKAGSVVFTACSLDGKPMHILLEDVKIPFEPSVYGGDGTETRKSICFSGASEELVKRLTAMEESIGASSSCMKDDLIRCKINTERVRNYDSNRKAIDTPKQWRGLNANVQVHVRGRWQTRQSSGLSLEVTDVQFVETREPPCPFK